MKIDELQELKDQRRILGSEITKEFGAFSNAWSEEQKNIHEANLLRLYEQRAELTAQYQELMLERMKQR